jgi:hypothetical protein
MADEKERIVGYRPCPFCKKERKEPSGQSLRSLQERMASADLGKEKLADMDGKFQSV